MLHGAIGKNWVTLAGDFTPTLNTEDDPTTLKPNESPACYGVDCEREGRLATGSCPTGTAYSAPMGTSGATAWYWWYNRLWYPTGSTFMWGPPYYRDVHFPHEVGDITTDATIIDALPVFGDSIILITASGSHLLSNATDPRGMFQLSQFVQGFYEASSLSTILNTIPYVCNAAGLFSYDGREIKEWTRNIRGALGTFASKTLRYDAAKKFVILYSTTTPSAVLETETGKLFDYGTSGFLFTTRTLANPPSYSPFEVDRLAFSVEHGSTAGGKIQWQTKSEDASWQTELPIDVPYAEEKYTRIEVPVQESARNCHRFAVRLTSLSSNIYIRSIQVCAVGLAEEHSSK